MENRDYFDAKFEGLEKLMDAQSGNLRGHIIAVSDKAKLTESSLITHALDNGAHGLEAVSNKVNAVDVELATHEKDSDAHGLGVTRKADQKHISLLGLLIAAATLLGVFLGKHLQ